MLKRILIFIIPALAVISACKKGFEGNPSQVPPPETFMAVDTLYRTGENRLTTLVQANWWGNSKGGFITGYEVSTDNQVTWTYTRSQDSTFLIRIPPGQDTADVVIYVRAIDHLGQKDLSPASTLFPIKNSKPSVKFVFSQPVGGIPSQNPTICFPVLKYNIYGEDPDGSDDLSQYELYLNDTNRAPLILPPNTSSFMLVSNDPGATDSSICKVYINGSNNPIAAPAAGLRHNSLNTVYVRAIDKALSRSNFIAAPQLWVKRVVSDLLVVNAYSSNKVFVQNFYLNNLKNIGIINFDTLQATELVSNNYTQLQPDFQAQNKTFAMFSKILWFGDDATFSFSFGQRTTGDFFNKGGKLFMAVAINSSFDPLSNFLDWTPIRNLVNPPSGSVFRVNNNALVKPVNSTWPVIKSTAIIASARPFEISLNTPTTGFDSLYYGGIIESKTGMPPTDWTGQSAVLAKRFNVSDNRTNFVVSSLPLERFNGNNNTDSLFRKVFLTELGF